MLSHDFHDRTLCKGLHSAAAYKGKPRGRAMTGSLCADLLGWRGLPLQQQPGSAGGLDDPRWEAWLVLGTQGGLPL